MIHAARIVVAVTVILAMIAAPFTAPAAAAALGRSDQPMPVSMAVMAMDMTDADLPGQDRAGKIDPGSEMPCCPSDAPPACDKACPLMMLCMAQCFQITEAASSERLDFALAGFAMPGNDEALLGLTPSPPARPPRT